MKLKYYFFCLAFFLISSTHCFADSVWQWSVKINSVSLNKANDHPRAFLWIPPNCNYVHGIVVGQNNMLEEGILQDGSFRESLAKLDFAEIFITPTFNTWEDAAKNDSMNTKFNQMLKQLSSESGYAEIQNAPIVPIGHSAMASFPWNFAAWNPNRTLAILSVHGDAPLTNLVGNGRPNAVWGKHNINGIPGLMVMGEYEWWIDRLTPAITFQEKYPKAPIAFFADAGNGHFNFSKQLIDYLSMFIKKAEEERMPENLDKSSIIKLKPVYPQNGWLIQRWRKDTLPTALAAPYYKYTGDRKDAFWCFDKEMAETTEKYYAKDRGKLPQLVDFVQNDSTIPINPKAFELVDLKFPALDASLIFKLKGTFLNKVPGGNPTIWTEKKEGAYISHSDSSSPVQLSRIIGPVQQLGMNTFAIRLNRLSLPYDRRMGDVWLMASHSGDSKYKHTVEQALMRIPFGLKEGKEQKISFPKIKNQKATASLIRLNATSSSGLPVYYFVREGPAEMDGDILKLTAIPPRAKYPVRITVVAWQYGRNIQPKVQSAKQVEQSFLVFK